MTSGWAISMEFHHHDCLVRAKEGAGVSARIESCGSTCPDKCPRGTLSAREMHDGWLGTDRGIAVATWRELLHDLLVKAHKRVFGEDLLGDPDSLDIYVTRIAPDGTRLGTSVVGTPEDDELYGLRGGKDAAYVAGRKEFWNAGGTGFDALAAEVSGATGAVQVLELDVDRSDIAFDVAPLSESELVLVGASGYTQNPHGASISEKSQAFAYILAKNGVSRALSIPNRGRHNETRSLSRSEDGRWLAAGMLNGPGTHSGDGDATLVRADGFLTELRFD